MPDAYAYARERVAAALSTWTQGAIQLIRTTEAPADEATPWQPGTATTAAHDLDAVVKGIAAQYLTGTSVVASDLMVVAAPGEVEPRMGDLIRIGDGLHEIKQIERRPGAGTPAAWVILVSGTAARDGGT